jgi:DNA-directed RNA polymerase specialized sigma24 family protein
MKHRTKVDLVADVQDSLHAVEAMPPEQRARTAHALWPQVLDIQALVSGLRRSGVRGMRAEGLSLAAIGERLGMSVSRVKQIERGLERKQKGESDAV